MVAMLSAGQEPDYWNQQARETLQKALNAASQHNKNIAQNVILFLGDGMSIPTVTSTRIYKGQREGKTGEESTLVYEEFPHVALSKTYNTDYQVPDSAGTATAFLAGVKTKRGLVGLDDRAIRGDCTSAQGHEVPSIVKMAKEAGFAVGVVTNTRLTHATPAAAYANSPSRDWQSDLDIPDAEKPFGCKDIALQFLENFEIDVAMGGGRSSFMPTSKTDYGGNPLLRGIRQDGRNLIDEWRLARAKLGRADFVWNKEQFDNIDPNSTDYILGLFNYEHMDYEALRDDGPEGEPSIIEMTEKAISLLRRKKDRFFLLVEGGRIDMAHHTTRAGLALSESLALEQAVAKAIEMTDDQDTLIIVTSDHSHTMYMAGYPSRGNPILGINDKDLGLDQLPYTTLGYANGPTAALLASSFSETGKRPDITSDDTEDPQYTRQSLVPMLSETHAGDDVAIFAKGPMSHLFHSVHEQNYIMHVMQYAACIGDYTTQCHTRRGTTTTGSEATLTDVRGSQ
ncbi:alkaline phosphatase-like [Asterias amurensis]|uniref:alkaline phosphatase-like n=1 Tax=Asterias amurensis TaxID=7602 RepID=UPI003AB64762